MKRKHLIGFILALIVLLTGCTEADVLDNSIKGFMTVLSSDELKGRLVGSEENQLTAAYLAYKFKAFGLKPYTEDSYFHEYKQYLVPIDKEIHTMSIEFMDGTKKNCVYGEDFSVQIPAEKLDIAVPVTFDIKDPKLTEKIAVVSSLKEGGQTARTSKCIIVKSTDFLGTVPRIGQTSPIIQASQKLYEELITKSVKTISINLSYPNLESTEKNVIGKIPGKDSKKAVVISAHFDHVGYAGKTIYNGAVDNASGTAVVLDLAKRISEKAKKNPFNMDIIFACYNGEEYFLLGSDAFARDIEGKYNEIYNINIDCVGKKDSRRLLFGAEEGTSEELIKDISPYLEKHGIECGNEAYGASDHVSFSSLGFYAITLGQENLRGGNGAIHSPQDKIDNIDISYINKLSSAVYDFILSAGDKNCKVKNMGDDNELMNKIFEIEANERANLKYNEFKIIEVEGTKWRVSGNKLLTSIEEIKKFYPGISILKTAGIYSFRSAYINNIKGLSGSILKDEAKTNETGKVYTYSLAPENIFSAKLEYVKEKDLVSIDIFKSSQLQGNRFYVLDRYDTEEFKIEGANYTFLKQKGNKSIEGIYRKYSINGKQYDVVIKKSQLTEVEINGVKSQKMVYNNTLEGITETIKQIKAEDIVKSIGF